MGLPASAAPATAAHWFGVWAPPPDRPAQAALALAALLAIGAVVPGGARAIASVVDFAALGDLTRKRRFLSVASFAAAFLSLGYIAFYLRGGPRADDAAVQWLQGRALSHGDLTWTAPEPTASFHVGELLLRLPDRLVAVTPPGFALLLVPGFLVGAPMLIGPLLAAGSVLATWLLGRELASTVWSDEARVEQVGRVAAGLSVVCAALRYFTAEPLPHAAAAVLVCMASWGALRARRTRDERLFGLTGAALGMLLCTQPLSTVSVGAVALAMVIGAPRRLRAVTWLLGAAVPGVVLFLAARHAATGHALWAPQTVYASLAGGARPALGTAAGARAVLHRLGAHARDIANFEPLALLVLLPLVGRVLAPGARMAALIIAGELALGSLTRGERLEVAAGGPLLAAVPLEHALIALGLSMAFPRALASAAMMTLGAALAGFAVHASFVHQALATSDLGRPRFEPDVMRDANVSHGLLFFDDDDGFRLAHDPGLLASHGIEAARMRGDDHDRLLYDSLGHPPTHRYLSTAQSAWVSPWTPPGAGDVWRFEAESEWPAASGSGASATVQELGMPCVSGGRALVIAPSAQEGQVAVELPIPRGATAPDRRAWNVAPRVVQRGGPGTATLELTVDLQAAPIATWTWVDDGKAPMCLDLPAQVAELGGDRTRAWLVLRVHGGTVTLDKTTLRPR